MDRLSPIITGALFGDEIGVVAHSDPILNPAPPAARRTRWHQHEEHGCPGRGEVTAHRPGISSRPSRGAQRGALSCPDTAREGPEASAITPSPHQRQGETAKTGEQRQEGKRPAPERRAPAAGSGGARLQTVPTTRRLRHSVIQGRSWVQRHGQQHGYVVQTAGRRSPHLARRPVQAAPARCAAAQRGPRLSDAR